MTIEVLRGQLIDEENRLTKYRTTLEKVQAQKLDNRVIGMWKSRVKRQTEVVDKLREQVGALPVAEDPTDVPVEKDEAAEAQARADAQEQEREQESPDPTPDPDPTDDDGEPTTTPNTGQAAEKTPKNRIGKFSMTDRGFEATCPICGVVQLPYPDQSKTVNPLGIGGFKRVHVDCKECGKQYTLVAESQEGEDPQVHQTRQREAAATAAKPRPKRTESKPRPKRSKTGGLPHCLCGCGRDNNPGSKFVMGHDAKLKSLLLKIERGDEKPEALAPYTIQQFVKNPELTVAGYTADRVLELAGVKRD